MGIGAKSWRELAIGAADLLGDGWVMTGKGASTRLVRAPVGWWWQFVGYEDTALGRLIAYNSFLGRPPHASQTGETWGTTSERFVVPGEERRRRFEDLASPAGVADWATAVSVSQLDLAPAHIPDALAHLEAIHANNLAHGLDPFDGPSLQRLVAMRAVCGTRSREELVADIDTVLADPSLEHYQPYASTRRHPRTNRDYFTALREAAATGDRDTMHSVIGDARLDSLHLLEVPDHAISEPVFPEPAVGL